MELTEVKAGLAKTQAERDGLKAELERMQDELEHAQTELAIAKQSSEGVRGDFDELSQQKQASEAKSQSAEGIILALTTRLKEATVRVSELEEQVQQQRAKIEELQSQVNELSKKLSSTAD